MNNKILTILGILGIGLVVVIMGSVFTVHQTEQALVLQFGEAKRVIQDPGLKFKMPFVQNVIFYDRRVLDLDPPAEEVIASDQKRLVADAYARYRIVNPLMFFKTVGTEAGLRVRLARVINASLRSVIGGVTLSSVLSEERAEIMTAIKDRVNGEAKDFGVDVIDVRLRRTDLPAANSEAVYARMKSERDREAREFRAQGAEIGQRIRSRADRERTVLLAEGQKKAQFLRGDGDAISVKIYADAFGQDPEFFAFYRSMQAYRESLGSDTTMVLSPDSDFFRFFGNLKGKRSNPKK